MSLFLFTDRRRWREREKPGFVFNIRLRDVQCVYWSLINAVLLCECVLLCAYTHIQTHTHINMQTTSLSCSYKFLQLSMRHIVVSYVLWLTLRDD